MSGKLSFTRSEIRAWQLGQNIVTQETRANAKHKLRGNMLSSTNKAFMYHFDKSEARCIIPPRYIQIRAWRSSKGPLKLKLASQSGQSAIFPNTTTPTSVEAETYFPDSLAVKSFIPHILYSKEMLKARKCMQVKDLRWCYTFECIFSFLGGLSEQMTAWLAPTHYKFNTRQTRSINYDCVWAPSINHVNMKSTSSCPALILCSRGSGQDSTRSNKVNCNSFCWDVVVEMGFCKESMT